MCNFQLIPDPNNFVFFEREGNKPCRNWCVPKSLITFLSVRAAACILRISTVTIYLYGMMGYPIIMFLVSSVIDKKEIEFPCDLQQGTGDRNRGKRVYFLPFLFFFVFSPSIIIHLSLNVKLAYNTYICTHKCTFLLHQTIFIFLD